MSTCDIEHDLLIAMAGTISKPYLTLDQINELVKGTSVKSVLQEMINKNIIIVRTGSITYKTSEFALTEKGRDLLNKKLNTILNIS